MGEHNTTVSPRIVRMEQELEMLQQKCNAIREFTKSEKWAKVNQINKELLGAQYSAMQTYARILNIRIKIAYGEDAGAGRVATPQGTTPATGNAVAPRENARGAALAPREKEPVAQKPVGFTKPRGRGGKRR